MRKHNRKYLTYSTSLVLLLFSALTIATAQTPQQIAQKAFRSTVLLVMEDKNGQPLSLGSGFFVGQEQIATNLHVVEGATRGYAKLVGKETKFNIEGYTAIDEKRDLIILKFTAFGTQSISLGNSDLAQVGQTVYAVGNPRGLEGTFSDGIISSIRPAGNDKLIQITAPLSPGSSGGPVLNRKGEVIGVSVLTIRDGQNLNFAIPSNYLKTLIPKVGYAKPLSQAKSNKGQRSLLADFGNRSIEGVSGGKFTWDGDYLGNKQFSYSLRNRIRQDVMNVHYLVVFYDKEDDPIDVTVEKFSDSIPAGLAKRIYHRYIAFGPKPAEAALFKLTKRMEIRILDFEIVK
ncbi:MAG: S1C family serine protease [Candidatus Poribacteria bacterium]|nr:S1C family serine protease [Candidatus Poribacteria bacterium]